ncbi:MAG: hypothetical protein H6721_34405 [Sandaracinus sp.]|nr:hypothetical protein [Sandaracinus sp.]
MSEQPEEHASIIRCPRCRGADDFRLIERTDSSRRVLGVDPDGNVEVEQEAEIEDLELGVDARFECRNRQEDGTVCHYRWHLPSWLIRRLVYY